jgi:membrane-bound lytic murein transglycosylase F
MMLTLRTASDLGVENRLDPEQAIYGGAAYMTRLQRKVPDRITEPDRTWLALAAYNVGFGHLEDARRITEAQGYDPDRWLNVKRHLPLLTQKKWYSTTRYGYARGNEPVQYVQNIRNYYDLLVWHTEHRQGRPPGPEPSVPAARAPKAL